MNNDLEHLKWLSIGFYVHAGLTALFACFPIIHLVIGIALLTGGLDNGKGEAPPAIFGLFFAGFAAIFILLGWAFAICSFLAARYLKQQKNYTFVFVMAAASCMFAPLGTVLGVFSIIVLLRDSVKALFEGQKHQFGGTPPDWK